jgi:hypothetical protein
MNVETISFARFSVDVLVLDEYAYAFLVGNQLLLWWSIGNSRQNANRELKQCVGLC